VRTRGQVGRRFGGERTEGRRNDGRITTNRPTLTGLLEPCAVRAARTVLRGPGRGNAPRLPDRSFGSGDRPQLLADHHRSSYPRISRGTIDPSVTIQLRGRVVGQKAPPVPRACGCSRRRKPAGTIFRNLPGFDVARQFRSVLVGSEQTLAREASRLAAEAQACSGSAALVSTLSLSTRACMFSGLRSSNSSRSARK
jgi:hypothetical protein